MAFHCLGLNSVSDKIKSTLKTSNGSSDAFYPFTASEKRDPDHLSSPDCSRSQFHSSDLGLCFPSASTPSLSLSSSPSSLFSHCFCCPPKLISPSLSGAPNPSFLISTFLSPGNPPPICRSSPFAHALLHAPSSSVLGISIYGRSPLIFPNLKAAKTLNWGNISFKFRGRFQFFLVA